MSEYQEEITEDVSPHQEAAMREAFGLNEPEPEPEDTPDERLSLKKSQSQRLTLKSPAPSSTAGQPKLNGLRKARILTIGLTLSTSTKKGG
jgi:hypothetical protein